MSEVTLTPGQIGELNKKLRTAGITDHQAIQRLLDSKELFAQFVALLLEEKEESVPPSFVPQNSFLERLTQRTKAGKIEWTDCGEHTVEYVKNFYSTKERTFSATIDGFKILLIRSDYLVFWTINSNISFRLEIENGENSAVLRDPNGLFKRKMIKDLYRRVDGVCRNQSRLDFQQKKTENQESANALSRELLGRDF